MAESKNKHGHSTYERRTINIVSSTCFSNLNILGKVDQGIVYTIKYILIVQIKKISVITKRIKCTKNNV